MMNIRNILAGLFVVIIISCLQVVASPTEQVNVPDSQSTSLARSGNIFNRIFGDRNNRYDNNYNNNNNRNYRGRDNRYNNNDNSNNYQNRRRNRNNRQNRNWWD